MGFVVAKKSTLAHLSLSWQKLWQSKGRAMGHSTENLIWGLNVRQLQLLEYLQHAESRVHCQFRCLHDGCFGSVKPKRKHSSLSFAGGANDG